MGINITQLAPSAGRVSTLVWDKDMEAGAEKIFKGDLVGNVTGDMLTTYIMTPKTPYVYSMFNSGGPSANNTVSRDNMVLYNVMPNQLLTGTINAYFNDGNVIMKFLDKNWGILSAVNLTTVATNYTLPAGTNCIILTLEGGYQSPPAVYIAKFDIAAV